MAGSTRSTAAIALGEKLRIAREARDLSQRKLAELIGKTARGSGLISRWETGERSPKAEDLVRIADVLGLNPEEANELTEIAGSTGQTPWLAVTLPERRQQLNALLSAERTATHVTHVAPLLIPGVLQTAEFIRAIMIDGNVPANEIDERVNARIGRRHLITRREPAHLDVLLDEGAVRRVIGSRRIMAAQLQFLLELGEASNVDIRVVPFTAGWTQALTGSYILLDSDEAPSIVSLEMHRSGLILHDPEDIASYRRAAESVRERAMSSAATTELIAEVQKEMETE